MSLVANKKYNAEVTDAGVATTKAGLPQPYIKLNVIDDLGQKHHMTYYGSLKSEKSTEWCIKSLINAGFQGGDFDDLNKGKIMFKGDHKFTVTLEYGQNQDGTKSDKLKIQFINGAGLSKFEGAVPKQAATFARIKEQLGVKTQKPSDSGNW